MNQKYYSKVDKWLAVVFLMLIAVSLVLCFILLIYSSNLLVSALVSILIFIVGIIFPVLVLIHTFYELKEGSLYIKSGPFHWMIAISSIKSIQPSRSMLNGPALSRDR